MARNYLKRIGYYNIEKLSEKELRKYYRGLQSIFAKQIKRYSKVNPKGAKVYQKGGISYFPTLTELKEKSSGDELVRELIKRSQALEELTINRKKSGKIETDTLYNIPSIEFKRAKVADTNKRIIKTLHESGYKHISKSTLKNFGNFMDEMRKQYGKKLPDSLIIAEFFDSLKYNTKKKGTNFLMELWDEFKDNGYKPTMGTQNLFSS